MFDPRWLRDHATEFDRSLARRGLVPASDRLLALDAERRAVDLRLQAALTERNRLSKEIGQAKAKGVPVEPIVARVAALKEELRVDEEVQRTLQATFEAELASYPNVVADDVPDGPDESHNRVERLWSEPQPLPFQARQHDELGQRLGMSFDKAARISGARFVTLFGQLAKLERAIGQLMLDIQTGEHGYVEVAVPLLVRDQALLGTGQLPKFGDDLFKTTTDHWLIPTAEVPLTNLVREEILPGEVLPVRYTALTPCFRSEAGAAGKDTRGMIRQHQFMKVELVSITTPAQSAAEHERMTACAEAVLQRLELPYRVVTLCSGDLGFSAMKTYDIEVWLPGQSTYREISSCSNCGEFQARRMNARFRPTDGKGTRFVHTLNGSGLAVGRTLIAVLENGQQADGSVQLPRALVPYMGGVDRLVPLR